MASPWTFLNRLMPRRREPKQNAEVADVKPNVLALSGPAETESSSVSSARAAGELSISAVSEPDFVDHTPMESAVSTAGGGEGTVAADIVAADLPPSSLLDTVVVPLDAADMRLRVESRPRKQMGGARKPKLFDTTQVPSHVGVLSDDTLSLDDEIRLLRGQLVGKLQVQNAQLKKMLERFER